MSADLATLAQLVQTALRRPAAAAREARRLGIGGEELQRAIETFVEGGVAALRKSRGAEQWITFGLRGPFPIGGPAPVRDRRVARLLLDLRSAALRWLDRGTLGAFNLMWKPPGLRIRVTAPAPDEAAEVVSRWLKKRARLEPLQPPYEPEQHQFGGAAGMAIAHRSFTEDSLAALDILGRELSGEDVAVEELSLLCIGDLVARVSLDAWEQWDVWSNLRLTGRLPLRPPSLNEHAERALETLSERCRQALFERATVLRARPRRDREFVQRYEQRNEEAARALREAAARKQLLFGIRRVIPFWIIFHWNRWGLSPGRQMALAIAVERALSPKRSPREAGR